MADFFNKLKKGIDKSAKVISAKSNSAIELNKVKSEVNGLKKSKNEAFSTIGKIVYESVITDGFSLDLVQEQVESLKSFDASILEKEAEIERIKAETDAKLEEINSASDDIVDVKATEVVEPKEVEIQDTDEEI